MDDYLAARMVSDPFGLYDCDVPCDGSTAVIVSSAEAAHDLPPSAGALRGGRHRDPGAAVVGSVGRHHHHGVARRGGAACGRAPICKPADVDTAQLYDGFSFLTLAWIEALGFCGHGESGPFVENGRIDLGGELPLNTWGGQLSGGRLHGFGFVAEACRQLRGECGERQVADCEVAVVGVGGGPVAGCMLLTR